MDTERIPDGQYRAAFTRFEEGVAFGRRVWFVWFRLTEPGEFLGIEICRFYNVPKRTYLPRTHNLYLDFVQAIGAKPPRTLKPDFLKGCEVLVDVVTVKERIEGRRRILQPEDCWYSKIDRVIRITAGSPAAPRTMPRGRAR